MPRIGCQLSPLDPQLLLLWIRGRNVADERPKRHHTRWDVAQDYNWSGRTGMGADGMHYTRRGVKKTQDAQDTEIRTPAMPRTSERPKATFDGRR